jgi:hypothetical protein
MEKQIGPNAATIAGAQSEVKLYGALDRIVTGAVELRAANIRLQVANILRGKSVDPLESPIIRNARNEVMEKLEPFLFSVAKFVESTPQEAPQTLASVPNRVSAVMVALKPELEEALVPLTNVWNSMSTSGFDRPRMTDQEVAVAVSKVLSGPFKIFYQKQRSMREIPSAIIA